MKTQYNSSQSGQVLLIAVLFSTILLTIGLSITQLTVQESRVTKLQEDTTRARSAAEAGIEAALQQGTDINDLSSILPSGSGISGGSVQFITEAGPTFITPRMSKDSAYTFYLTGYDPSTKSIITSNTFADDIVISLADPTGSYCSGSDAFALELTFISATGNRIVDRAIVDDCNLIEGTEDEVAFGDTLGTSTISPSPNILLMRIIAPNDNFDGAQISLNRKQQGTTVDVDFPEQGQTIVSEAQTQTDVARKVKLFQSWPQIPAELFVTTF